MWNIKLSDVFFILKILKLEFYFYCLIFFFIRPSISNYCFCDIFLTIWMATFSSVDDNGPVDFCLRFRDFCLNFPIHATIHCRSYVENLLNRTSITFFNDKPEVMFYLKSSSSFLDLIILLINSFMARVLYFLQLGPFHQINLQRFLVY